MCSNSASKIRLHRNHNGEGFEVSTLNCDLRLLLRLILRKLFYNDRGSKINAAGEQVRAGLS